MAITEVFIGSDHGGVGLRDLLARHLEEGGLVVRARFGPETAAESVDYPDVAQELCGAVLTHEGAMGLLVCGTGQGMAISANKVVGIRAGVASDPFSARMLRAHNDARPALDGTIIASIAGWLSPRPTCSVPRMFCIRSSYMGSRTAS